MKLTRLVTFRALAAVLLVAACGTEPVGVDAPDALFGKGGVKGKTNSWTVPGDFATIQEAIDAAVVEDGHVIQVGPGNFAGAFVDKSVHFQGVGNAIIDDGPMHPAGLSMGFRLLAGSDGATINHLTFTVDLAIMNGGAVDGVTVSHSTFLNTIQAVSNWRGNGWTISHNDIIDLRTRCGGGIGILVGDFAGGVVQDNVVSHNKISGTLHVAPGDCGGYAGSGIVAYADFRWGGAGAEEIRDNYLVRNKISLASDAPEVVGVVGIELTDTRDDENLQPVLFDNAIGFNDTRGTAVGIALTPENLDLVNDISRNLGIDKNNRGHGLHPSVFKPGG
jgi:hypothetical protein